MWTWTYEALEFTHDDEGDQVMALFSLSLSPEREEHKKKPILRGCFFTAYERDVSFRRL